MPDEMGTFRVDLEVENPVHPGDRRLLRSVLVDTGAELSWFPTDILESLGIERRKAWRFRQADGTVLTRWTGGVSVYLEGIWTVDEVVFGEAGDLVLLGSRSLEGLNLRVDPVSKRLVDAGPAPAASSRCAESARSTYTPGGAHAAGTCERLVSAASVCDRRPPLNPPDPTRSGWLALRRRGPACCRPGS
jgi:predicted aspartyl protease